MAEEDTIPMLVYDHDYSSYDVDALRHEIMGLSKEIRRRDIQIALLQAEVTQKLFETEEQLELRAYEEQLLEAAQKALNEKETV